MRSRSPYSLYRRISSDCTVPLDTEPHCRTAAQDVSYRPSCEDYLFGLQRVVFHHSLCLYRRSRLAYQAGNIRHHCTRRPVPKSSDNAADNHFIYDLSTLGGAMFDHGPCYVQKTPRLAAEYLALVANKTKDILPQTFLVSFNSVSSCRESIFWKAAPSSKHSKPQSGFSLPMLSSSTYPGLRRGKRLPNLIGLTMPMFGAASSVAPSEQSKMDEKRPKLFKLGDREFRRILYFTQNASFLVTRPSNQLLFRSF